MHWPLAILLLGATSSQPELGDSRTSAVDFACTVIGSASLVYDERPDGWLLATAQRTGEATAYLVTWLVPPWSRAYARVMPGRPELLEQSALIAQR